MDGILPILAAQGRLTIVRRCLQYAHYLLYGMIQMLTEIAEIADQLAGGPDGGSDGRPTCRGHESRGMNPKSFRMRVRDGCVNLRPPRPDVMPHLRTFQGRADPHLGRRETRVPPRIGLRGIARLSPFRRFRLTAK